MLYIENAVKDWSPTVDYVWYIIYIFVVENCNRYDKEETSSSSKSSWRHKSWS